MSITFTNEPKLSPHEVDRSRNESRITIVAGLTDFVENNTHFKGKDVCVTFAQDGVSSLVMILDARGEKYVLKTPLITGRGDLEPLFLRTWEAVGVLVPHIFEEGKLGEYPYALMNYIDAPLLKNLYGSREALLEKGMYKEMGRVMQRMHVPRAYGYGIPREGKVEYNTFGEWLSDGYLDNRIAYGKENGLFQNMQLPHKAVELLKGAYGNETKSAYCHNDFDACNIFGTEPITVFDPNPSFNHPYLDLGTAITTGTSLLGTSEVSRQLKEGYFQVTRNVMTNFLLRQLLLRRV